MANLLDLRTAFYPCCGKDIRAPLTILGNYVDRVIFCDISPAIAEYHEKVRSKAPDRWPSSTVFIGSALEVINCLQRIDVLFYRCDSGGEGGSAAMILKNSFLQLVLDRMPLEGGLIITDGSNTYRKNFERIIRPSGIKKLVPRCFMWVT